MGNHRADVATDITSSMTPPPAAGGYVGRRRAAVPVDDLPVTPSATPYVGKRRALTAEPGPTELTVTGGPATRVSSAGEPVVHVRIEPPEGHPERRSSDELADDERVTTAEIQAIVDSALHDTAPRPRIRLDQAPAVSIPAPRHGDPTRAVVEPEPERLFREPSTDSLIDLPRISVAATYAADLSGDTTALLPVVTDGGRRRARTTRSSARHRRPSMPLVAGIVATLAAVGGAVLTTHPDLSAEGPTRLTGASALTGTSATETVGGSHGRGTSVSRDDDRTGQSEQTEAKTAADARARALGNLAEEAAGQQKYLNSNQWGLPVQAHVYHLTGRFGDVSGLWATIHTGLDFAAPYGTPIHAVARGVVTETGWGGAYGNRTIVTLPDGTEIWYCHQSRFGTSVGDTVEEGQVIGYIGATGNVTGPHVHIEVRPGGGDPVDPDPAFKAHGVDPDADQ